MGYIEKHLAPGEEVAFRTRLHPVIFAGTVVFAACVIGVTALVVARNDLAPETVRLLWLAAAAIIVVSFTPPWLRWRTSEFAVTNRRVLVKVGLLSIHTIELLLPKVEAIGVDQTLAGRVFGYGTLRIVGTGGTVEAFPRVAHPQALREAVVRQAPGSAVSRAR
ncbi:MAG TPA: PH domain-containing protein [Candidatus Binatus sp.]|nr:PH domain-containing protein [Candidatus Binatus sp.]